MIENTVDNINEDIKPKKRGRKPSKKDNYYFSKEEEDAVMKYINSDSQEERDYIFRKVLHSAFIRMVESIIRRFKYSIPTEEFDEMFCDTLSFLITKISNYDSSKSKVTIDDITFQMNNEEVFNKKEKKHYPIIDNTVIIEGREYIIKDGMLQYSDKKYPIEKLKAFSYCGTICKNYLTLKVNQYRRKRDKNLSYDVIFPTVDNDMRVDTTDDLSMSYFHNELINRTISEIQKMLSVEYIHKLNDNEQKIGYALLEMLMNWEEIFKRLENKKFNKTSVWFFLKERTDLDSKNIREGLRKYKNLYFVSKEKLINE